MNQGQIMQLRDIARLLCGNPNLRYISVPRKGKRPQRSIVEPEPIDNRNTRISVMV